MKQINRKGQEEMVGFALIIIIVAVILLVFLNFYLKQPSEENLVESYEVESFIQSVLQYTVEYESEYLSLRKLIKKCNNYDEGCEVLKNELENIMQESWTVEGGGIVKGYKLEIVKEDKEILNIKNGDETVNYKSPEDQDLDGIKIKIKIYY